MSIQADKIIAVRTSKTVYQDANTVLKVFDEEHSKADVFSEALNQARAEETGLHIPKILEIVRLDGKWAIVSEFVEGKTLAMLMEEHKEKEDEYLELFVRLQMEVHAKRATALPMLKDKMRDKISRSRLDATDRDELQARLDAMPAHRKLCHGDFQPSNIILTEDSTPYLLDWSHATQGNAFADAARTYQLFCMEEKPELAEKYLHLFCRRSDTAGQYVRKWLPLVAAASAADARPAAREFLKRWIDTEEPV